MAWLIDTNVLSEIRRPKPDNRVLEFLAARPISELFVSAVTLAEIRFGIENQDEAYRKSLLTSWLEEKIRPMFNRRALPVDETIVVGALRIAHMCARGGYTFSLPDLLIGATALDRGMVVVSRDTTPFLKANVPVENPWHYAQMP
jgi:predicted nucleic acid-binding protein